MNTSRKNRGERKEFWREAGFPARASEKAAGPGAGALLLAGGVYCVARKLEGERHFATGSLENRFTDERSIEYQGKAYAYNQRV